MKFELERTDCLLSKVNLRVEKHGTENVPAIDLNFVAMLPNGVLAMFHPELRSSLYGKEKDRTAGDLADQAADPDALTRLLFPKLGTVKWEDECVGAVVTIHYGTQKNDVVLDSAKVGKFRITAADGGSVSVGFQVQASGVDTKISNKLFDLLDSKAQVTIEPPIADPVPDGAA